ncbi:MAG: hypothetical protein WD065_16365 [Planctomycetaceae bacterium]
MSNSLPLDRILQLSGTDFNIAFYDYLTERKSQESAMSPIEEEAWLVLTLLLDIEMEGFIDLFYQLYSLRDCDIIEDCLKKLGLQKLATQFAEAKFLYTGGRNGITEVDFRGIDPWIDTLADETAAARFDAIGNEILAEGSEIYLVDRRVEIYVKECFG